VVGGIPNWWQTKTNWYDHFQKYDGLLVWQPQNFNNDFTSFKNWGKDYYLCTKRKRAWDRKVLEKDNDTGL